MSFKTLIPTLQILSVMTTHTCRNPGLTTGYILQKKHNILDQECDFQFVAYIILKNADASINDAVQHLLVKLIPRLGNHLTIKGVNKNGNII